MNRYRCTKCNGDQYSSVSEITPCIYCGAVDVKKEKMSVVIKSKQVNMKEEGKENE